MECFSTPFVFNDELQALRILPPQAYFEYIKTLMKPYGEWIKPMPTDHSTQDLQSEWECEDRASEYV